MRAEAAPNMAYQYNRHLHLSRLKPKHGRPRHSILDRELNRLEAVMDTDLDTLLVDYDATEFEGEYRWDIDGSFESCQTTKEMFQLNSYNRVSTMIWP